MSESTSADTAEPQPRQPAATPAPAVASPAPAAAPHGPGRVTAAAALGVLGALAVIGAILYLAGAANSISFLVGGVRHGHHLLRAAVAVIAGVILLTAARYVSRTASGPN